MSLWKAFPPNVVLKQILVPGGAYRAKYEFESEGKKLRYFFIINAYPKRDNELVLVTATTKIGKHRRHRASTPDVLVYIKRSEYPALKKRSLIDCASALLYPKDTLYSAVEKHEVQPLSSLPSEILERIRNAVRAARTLEPRTKRLVLPADE